MKILCDRVQLQEAFSVVSGVAPQKTSQPILQNVHMNANETGLWLMATDYEVSARVQVDSVKVEQPGSVLLPAREANALLRELRDPTVCLESKEFRCTLDSGGGSFVLLGDDPAQFPKGLELEVDSTVTIAAGVFMGMVRRTIFAAAKEESRYMINGVLLDCREECLRLVATDGRRLSLTYSNLEAGKDIPTVKAVIPIRTLQILMRAIPDDSAAQLDISFGANQIRFQHGKTSLISQLLECKFPEYDVVIPKAAETSVEISRELLESNLRKVAILSSGDLRMVCFRFNSSNLEMSAESSGLGRGDVVMDVDVKGAGGSVNFNPDYLLEALKACDMETVRLDMTDDSTPVKLTLGEAFTYVLMPISGS